ncbi:ABC-2 family transporter protein [Thalassoglobus neptunius]|uniref:ABC-2 family transporter protein n=1 Tax=Thalassoglobus neptunius TaxID=1938619 RepID=A0A5C5WP96_9PLAN|nr:hypothetical protein [Thalassoglobus neptunius]TWT51931.1 ABC-2 family transporter protein [Thalassoglobus neptunius]
MLTLFRKDVRLNRLPIVVCIVLLLLPYFAAAFMMYRVYAPELPSAATVGDYLATAAVFGLMLNIVAGGIAAGNSVACERMDGSAVFLACQPVSRLQCLSSKAALVGLLIGGVWLVHCSVFYVIAPSLDKDSSPYMNLENPVIFAASALVVAVGAGWLASILGRNPSMAICAALAAAFLVPWLVYIGSFWLAIAPDDVVLLIRTVQWSVGVTTVVIGSCVYLRRVEP